MKDTKLAQTLIAAEREYFAGRAALAAFMDIDGCGAVRKSLEMWTLARQAKLQCALGAVHGERRRIEVALDEAFVFGGGLV